MIKGQLLGIPNRWKKALDVLTGRVDTLEEANSKLNSEIIKSNATCKIIKSGKTIEVQNSSTATTIFLALVNGLEEQYKPNNDTNCAFVVHHWNATTQNSEIATAYFDKSTSQWSIKNSAWGNYTDGAIIGGFTYNLL